MRLNPWNAAVAAIAASWGFVSVIVAGVDLPGEALVFWRCVLAALTLPAILLLLGRLDALVLRRRRLQVLGLGVLLALHWVLFFETIKRASVAVAILLVYTAPIFLAVLAPLLLPEGRSRVGLAALAISGPGIALIALGGEGEGGASGVAIGTGLGAALTYALLIIGTKSVVRVLSPFTLTFWNYAIVSLVLLPFLAWSNRRLPSAEEWPAVLVLGALLTAVLGVLYVRTLRDVTAQAAGLLSYVEPVSASLLAWAILGEAVGWEVAVGGLAVLAGGALVVLYEGAEPTAPDAPLATAEE
ncbi:MAG TPA: DMT family transporter [Gaiellaceae bacterium]|nr:DMT family transporter [Gaiellaceae bacterium]